MHATEMGADKNCSPMRQQRPLISKAKVDELRTSKFNLNGKAAVAPT